MGMSSSVTVLQGKPDPRQNKFLRLTITRKKPYTTVKRAGGPCEARENRTGALPDTVLSPLKITTGSVAAAGGKKEKSENTLKSEKYRIPGGSIRPKRKERDREGLKAQREPQGGSRETLLEGKKDSTEKKNTAARRGEKSKRRAIGTRKRGKKEIVAHWPFKPRKLLHSEAYGSKKVANRKTSKGRPTSDRPQETRY